MRFGVGASVDFLPWLSGNRLERDGGDCLEILARDPGAIGALSRPEIAYVVSGALTVNNNATLTIDPGVTPSSRRNRTSTCMAASGP